MLTTHQQISAIFPVPSCSNLITRMSTQRSSRWSLRRGRATSREIWTSDHNVPFLLAAHHWRQLRHSLTWQSSSIGIEWFPRFPVFRIALPLRQTVYYLTATFDFRATVRGTRFPRSGSMVRKKWLAVSGMFAELDKCNVLSYLWSVKRQSHSGWRNNNALETFSVTYRLCCCKSWRNGGA